MADPLIAAYPPGVRVLAAALAALAAAASPPARAQRPDITITRPPAQRGDAAHPPPPPAQRGDAAHPPPPPAQRGEAGRGASDDPAVERRRAAVAKELVALGGELRRQIVAGDTAALLARVPPAGLRCAGRVVPRAKVARDLKTKGAWLHDALFGRGAAARGAPASLADLLRTAREVAVVVTFREDAASGPAGLPCLDYRAQGLATPGAPLCFERRDGRWWFAESLYPCG